MTVSQDKQACNWGMLCHLTALCLYIGIPFGNLIVPLVIWLTKKDRYPFVDEQGKECLNFQISMTIYAIIAGVLCYILIGYLLMGILVLVHIVLIITATVKASSGKSYRYPFTIRLIN